jgi:iron complex transport system ATP-binding protein
MAHESDRLLLLDRGRLQAIGTPEQVLEPERLQSVYGVNIQVDFDRDPPLILVR